MDNRHDIPESAAPILSSLHGRQIGIKRCISKHEFTQAILHGRKTKCMQCRRTGKDTWPYDYKEITCVTDASSTVELTSWVTPAWGINIEKVNITNEMLKDYNRAIVPSKAISSWKSHAVVIVDQIRSMRNTDKTNGVSRSDMVWLTLAVDYVGKRMRSGEATSQDHFSLIAINKVGKVWLKYQPFD